MSNEENNNIERDKKVEIWIESQRKTNNTLAETFYQILRNTSPEVKTHFYGQMSLIIQAVDVLRDLSSNIGKKNVTKD